EPSADFSQDALPVSAAIDGNVKTGWGVDPQTGREHVAVFEVQGAPAAAEAILTVELLQNHGAGHTLGRFRISATAQPQPVRAPQIVPREVLDVLAIEPAKRTDEQRQKLSTYYRSIAPALDPVRKQLAEVEAAKAEFLKIVPTTLVSMTTQPREMRVLPRGNW